MVEVLKLKISNKMYRLQVFYALASTKSFDYLFRLFLNVSFLLI